LHIQSDIRLFLQSFQDILIPWEVLHFSKEINAKVENIF
jgi:hypothetical protein